MTRAPLLAWMVALAMSAGAARGAEPSSECTLHLAPDDAAPEWKAAVRAVEARVGVLATESGDCRVLVVRVVADGAWVELTTVSGKTATRHIGGPAELDATVEALLVTVPLVETKKIVSKPEPPVVAPPELTNVAPLSDRHLTILLGLEFGGRMGWPGRFVSPALGGFAGVSLDRWELGIFGRWETSYSSSVTPLPPGVQLSAVVAGVTFGRRFPLSPALGLLVQGHLGLAMVSEEGNETEDLRGDTEGETRMGLEVGVSVPHQASVRFRPMLGLEVAPTRSHHSKHVDPTLPAPPKWAVMFMLALESEVL